MARKSGNANWIVENCVPSVLLAPILFHYCYVFRVLSSSEHTPTLIAQAAEWGMQYQNDGCRSSASQPGCSRKLRNDREGKGGRAWSGMNGKCTDQVDVGCEMQTRFHTFPWSPLAWQPLAHRVTNMSRCKTSGWASTGRLCRVHLWKRSVRRSEWLHRVLIYYDNTCTQSIKNYLGTEHWPLSNK